MFIENAFTMVLEAFNAIVKNNNEETPLTPNQACWVILDHLHYTGVKLTDQAVAHYQQRENTVSYLEIPKIKRYLEDLKDRIRAIDTQVILLDCYSALQDGVYLYLSFHYTNRTEDTPPWL